MTGRFTTDDEAVAHLVNRFSKKRLDNAMVVCHRAFVDRRYRMDLQAKLTVRGLDTYGFETKINALYQWLMQASTH